MDCFEHDKNNLDSHRRVILRWFLSVLGFFWCLSVDAQIDTTRSVDYLVREILAGNGVLVGKVKYVGAKQALALYRDSTSQVGIEEGILLSSGNVFYALGPNKSAHFGGVTNAPGDVQLDAIAKGKTYDAAVLEFEFVTVSENLSFEFVFASEEYLEYVGSKFNDVFAFFVEGPGLENINIAKLPDEKTPITVNTVNHEKNKKYYIDNTYMNVTDAYVWDVRNRKVIWNKHFLKEEVPAAYYTQFDGFTTLLTATCSVIPNRVYTIKMAIADVSDRILDSGVFLKGGSFSSYGKEFVDLQDYFVENKAPQKITRITPQFDATPLKLALKIKPVVNVGRVEFDFDQYTLTATAKAAIVQFFKQWQEAPEYVIEIFGHTDSMGSLDYNYQLAILRAQAVAHELQMLGVPPENLRLYFKGELEPIRPNTTSFGRARNRRVELQLQS
ncbi:MAG: OmpA family protein [Bacteroidota bacterium]